jgi:hypothetical protein
MGGSYDSGMPRSHKVVLALLALLTVAFFMAFIRVRRPSPFATGSGFGVGHGAEVPMFGASPRKGAAGSRQIR